MAANKRAASIDEQLNKLLLGARIEVTPSYSEFYKHRWSHVMQILALTWKDARRQYQNDKKPITVRYYSKAKYGNPYRHLAYIPEILPSGLIDMKDISRSSHWSVSNDMQHTFERIKSANVHLFVENPRRFSQQHSGMRWSDENQCWTGEYEPDNPWRLRTDELDE